MKNTKSIRLSNTPVVQKGHITNPTITVADRVIHAASKLAAETSALAKKNKTDQNLTDLKALADTIESLA